MAPKLNYSSICDATIFPFVLRLRSRKPLIYCGESYFASACCYKQSISLHDRILLNHMCIHQDEQTRSSTLDKWKEINTNVWSSNLHLHRRLDQRNNKPGTDSDGCVISLLCVTSLVRTFLPTTARS